jgi:hypothetical protein
MIVMGKETFEAIIDEPRNPSALLVGFVVLDGR